MLYYTSIIVITWLTLAALSILVHENDRLSGEAKRNCYIAYLLIALAALAEWLGFYLDGEVGISLPALSVVKTFDYILTPIAGAALVTQMGPRDKLTRVLSVVPVVNIVFQVAALFGGWMVSVDASGHYHHGSLYFVYMLIYAAILVLVVAKALKYGRSFSRQNRTSVYAIVIVILVGVVLQEVVNDEMRVIYLALAIGVALLFIHNVEFAQLAQDENIARQNVQIMTDALTGLRSRYAYSAALKELAAQGPLPAGLVAFSVDVNGLKDVNDELGHDAGDELLCGAAACIQRAFGEGCECYRTGGDEFVVLATMSASQADDALARLKREERAWKGLAVHDMSMAAGCAAAADFPEASPEKLVARSDRAMYAAKAAYYQAAGHDRRRSA